MHNIIWQFQIPFVTRRERRLLVGAQVHSPTGIVIEKPSQRQGGQLAGRDAQFLAQCLKALPENWRQIIGDALFAPCLGARAFALATRLFARAAVGLRLE